MPDPKLRKRFALPGKPTEQDHQRFYGKKEEAHKFAAPAPDESLSASPLDTTTLQNVKDWLNIIQSDQTDDDLIQAMITAFGTYLLWRTGLGAQNGNHVQSPFNSVCVWDEFYDGLGGDAIITQNRPITNVTAVIVDQYSIPQSAGPAYWGWVVDGAGISVRLRQGFIGPGALPWGTIASPFRALAPGLRFYKGVQNIELQYSAGFSVTPFDLELASKRTVALNYKRRDWTGRRTRSLGLNAGSETYTEWVLDPQDEAVIYSYVRL